MSLSCRYRNIVVREKKYCFYDVFTLTAYCHLKGSTLLTSCVKTKVKLRVQGPGGRQLEQKKKQVRRHAKHLKIFIFRFFHLRKAPGFHFNIEISFNMAAISEVEDVKPEMNEPKPPCKSVIQNNTAAYAERRFGCNICGAKFVKNSGLNRHLKTHNDEKSFGCEFAPSKVVLSRENVDLTRQRLFTLEK
ncbi:unnamed protein product [Acanthosepion pharaonis]|uniref:C2H2-type domain-containing protein n=1 Tax=Acanthosepion pharaonis TaxID=158019 RepID=A0A812D988_ACAPH|nr:unnamed protein product [Sepia pharaonis]